MASKKNGLGRGLNEIMSKKSDTYKRGLEPLVEGLIGPPVPGPEVTPRERGYDLFAPAEGPPAPFKKPKPGMGEFGKEKIRRDLSSISPAYTKSDILEYGESEYDESEPPKEPPSDEAETPPSLPEPEYISDIKQSSKRPGFGARRPDKHPEFYGAGPTTSTRVHAIQWIPLIEADEYVGGDILVAFARPSRAQKGGAGSLYVYRSKDLDLWKALKGASSLGAAVSSVLGTGTPYSSESDSYYKGFHPGYTGKWIFDDIAKWVVIRPNNEIAGPDKSKVAESVLEGIDLERFTI